MFRKCEVFWNLMLVCFASLKLPQMNEYLHHSCAGTNKGGKTQPFVEGNREKVVFMFCFTASNTGFKLVRITGPNNKWTFLKCLFIILTEI